MRISLSLVVAALALNVHAVSASVEAKDPPPPKTITTATGLQYVELRLGAGAPAKKGDTVVVAFGTARLKDGKEVKSLLGDRAKPFKFVLGAAKVIKGFDEGVSGTRPGGKRRLIIPAALAYGSTAGADFPPNSDLIIEFELVSVVELLNPIESKKDSKPK